MITPRTTRLLRTPGFRALQRTIALAASGSSLDRLRDTLVIVSSAGAVDQLRRTLEELWLVERWTPAADERAALGLPAPDAAAGGSLSGPSGNAVVLPHIVTRGGLYRNLYERLDDPPSLLDDYAREVLFHRAAADAVARGDAPPFDVRPGLIPEMLSLYDALRRQHRIVDDFERLVGGALEAGAEIDRGARRLLQQTRFLVSAFRAYEARLVEDEALDEHGLRTRLLEEASVRPIRHVIVTVPDQRADAAGLWPADFDLLTRVPGLEAIDIVSTEAVLATGYLERMFETLPGIEVRAVPDVESPAPVLLAPPADGRHDPLHFTSRDREQELTDVAHRLATATARPRDSRDDADGDGYRGVPQGAPASERAASSGVDAPAAANLSVAEDDASADVRAAGVRGEGVRGEGVAGAPGALPATGGMAVVYQRPLPYLYLARQVFGARQLPWQAFDALPLAAEPFAAALDLVITFALSGYTRGAGIVLLRAPHFRFAVDGHEPTLAEIAACDLELREAGFLGGRDRLHALLTEWRGDETAATTQGHRVDGAPGRRFRGRPRALAVRALAALAAAADALQPLEDPALPSSHIDTLQRFVGLFERPADPLASSAPADSLEARHLRARGAILGTLTGLRQAFLEHGEREGPFRDLAALVHRWLEGQTFNPRIGERGLHLVDVQAAIYGRFTHVALVGVVESEWPAASSRTIFYPSSLLKDLGWPAEPERRAAARAVFDDLLRLARDEVSVSVFALEHDGIIRPSPFVEDLPGAALQLERVSPERAASTDHADSIGGPAYVDDRLLTVPAVTLDPGETAAWAALRASRTAIAAPQFHGWTGALEPRAYSVTGLDRYLQCPFRYFAAHVLRLEEEPERRPGLTPLERGRFEHEVFQRFFERWDAARLGAIDESSLERARTEFVTVVDEVLARLPAAERELERTRLLGSAVSAGLGERVFRFEAARLAPITQRLLEYSLDGEYVLEAPDDEPDEDDAPDDASVPAARATAPPPVRRRLVRLRGTADRIDLLDDGTMRVIDYKTGKASSAASSIQLPVYSHCAEVRLEGHGGRRWRVNEAGYLAFGRQEPFVTVVAAGDDAPKKVTQAIAKVVGVVDRIEEGAFPVTPVEPHNCIFCGFAAVCRKDYVEDD